jgi:hypothetical protein
LLLVMTAGLTARVYRTHGNAAFGFVLLVGLVSAFYAPIWAQLPVTTHALNERLFLPMWR